MDKKNGLISRKKAEKRQMILDAAFRIFTRDGYHHARVETIASEAGVGKGTVYEYFSNKMDLFQKMIEEKCEGMQQNVLQYEPSNGELRESIYQTVKSHIEISIQNQDLTFLIMKELPFMEKELGDWFLSQQAKRTEELRKSLAQAIESKLIRAVDIDALSILFGGLMAVLHLQIAMGEHKEKNMDQLSASLADILLCGIEPKKE